MKGIVSEGIFSIDMTDENNDQYNQRIGYIKENVLDGSNSDTALVCSDLYTAAAAITALTDSSADRVLVNYEVAIVNS